MRHCTTPTRLPRGQAAIQSFARTAKPWSTSVEGKNALLPISPSKKRKLNELESSDGQEQSTQADEPTTPSKTLRISELALSTPRNNKKITLDSAEATHSGHDSSKSLSSCCLKSTKISVQLSAPSVSEPEPKRGRPASFTDILNLHSSFLKALSLHVAQNGRANPVELRQFLHTVERSWKKRKVVARDLQRLMWVWNQDLDSSSGLGYRIANYGLGRICLERHAPEGQNRGNFDEGKLQERFTRVLELLWAEHQHAHENGKGHDKDDFAESLGVAPICDSLTPFTAFRKGQQRLQDLKRGVIREKMERLRARTTQDEPRPQIVQATVVRRGSLLDRIKSKELRQSKLPLPPSKETLLRRAAVQRIEEVVGILSLLKPAAVAESGSNAVQSIQRKPFKIDTIVQHVQDSSRNPISRDEVEECLQILAQADVAGEWVSIVTINQLKSVILRSCEGVCPKDIGAKVHDMKIGYEDNSI